MEVTNVWLLRYVMSRVYSPLTTLIKCDDFASVLNGPPLNFALRYVIAIGGFDINYSIYRRRQRQVRAGEYIFFSRRRRLHGGARG